MARRVTDFQTIRSEGGLLPPDLLRHVLDPKEKIPGTSPEDYGLPRGERINETITQSWNRLRRHWAEFNDVAQRLPEGEPGTGLTNDKWSLPLLRELGFGLLPTSAGPDVGGRTYAISRFFGPMAIHLVGCGLSLDRRAAGVRGAAAANPHGLLQEFLNRAEGYLWGIVSNGLRFRILRDNQALSRQSYLEFDLEAMFTGEVFSDFVLLWLMAHATRFTVHNGGRAATCWLERWTKLAEERGTRALESLKGGVEKALEVLGQGFVGHPRNTALRESLRSGALPLTDFHSQLLRIVYRLIFLFVAEDRTLEGIPLIHLREDSEEGRRARERYSTHYSTARLRELASHIKGSRHGDLWRQFNLLAGALSGDEHFAAARGHLALPALGSLLWSPESTRDLNAPGLAGNGGTELANTDFLEAIRHLAFTSQGKVLRPVDYRNLGSEELGGVYESLLALTPQISGDGARFTFAEFAGNERKTSGSYYTPDSLVQCLLDSALDPVIEGTIKDKTTTEAEKALLSLKVCDPAVGSGHFLVGAAHRLARHLARVRAIAQGEGEPSPPVYQHALRDVIGHCLYGVDINPMAAELCKVSLWLEALEPGKPLSFLDHHIRIGNSLLGTTPEMVAKGIPDDAFKPVEGDDKKACAQLKKRNKGERKGLGPLFAKHEAAIQAQLAKAAAALEEIPDDRPEDISRKAGEFRQYEITEDYRHKKLLADAWCAAFVMKKYLREPSRELSAVGVTQGNLNELAGGRSLPAELRAEIERLTGQYQFLHWHLAFPEVFAKGGFDCVLGNPPWEKIQLEEDKFFSLIASDIASASAKQRKSAIKSLEIDRPEIYELYRNALCEVAGQVHFVKDSGHFPLSGGGNVSTHSLFIELAIIIVATLGQVGLVVPSGLATQDTQKHLFAALTGSGRLRSLFDFENRLGLFPGIHPQFRFCLVAIGAPRSEKPMIDFAFLLQSPGEINEEGRCFQLSYTDLLRFSPNTLSCPQLISAMEATLLRRIYEAGTVVYRESTQENPWGWQSWQMFNETHEADLLVEGPVNKYTIPLYEGKLFHQFDHRYASYVRAETVEYLTSLDKRRPELSPKTRYTVARRLWSERVADDGYTAKWILAFRRITNATNERTSIFCILPMCITGSQSPAVKTNQNAAIVSTLLANLNSIVFDFTARRRVGGTDLNHFIIHQLPVLTPSVVVQQKPVGFGTATSCNWLLPRVLELTYTAWDLESFAQDCGYNGPPFCWDDERRFLLRCELDAAFFHLYLGSGEEWRKEPESLTKAFPTPRHAVEHMMETFPIVKRKDEAAHGSYRTKDTILEIYDALANSISTGQPYQTRLDPPPGPPEGGLPEWNPGQSKPTAWPSHIHSPKGVADASET